jgi:hypothetical protein
MPRKHTMPRIHALATMDRTVQRRSSAERPAGANAAAMIPPARRTQDDVLLFAPRHTLSQPFISQALPAALHEVLHSQYKDIAAKIAHE